MSIKICGKAEKNIQRDILEIEATFHIPLEIRCGRYDGGVYVIGNIAVGDDYGQW